MGADASIYSMLRPQVQAPGPLDNYAQGMQLKNLMGQGDLQALQLQQARQGIEDDQGTRQFYANLKPGEDPRNRINDLLRVNPKAGMAAQKFYQDADKAAADLASTKAGTHEKSMKMVGGAFANIAQNPTYEAIVQTLETLKSAGAIQDEGYKALMSKVPADAAQLPAFVNGVVTMTEHGLSTLKARAPDVTMVDSGQQIIPTNKNALAGPIGPVPGAAVTQKVQTPDSVASNKLGYANLGETKRHHGVTETQAAATAEAGKWTNDLDRGLQVNTVTGATRPITTDGTPIGRKDKELNDAQAKALLYSNRMEEAEKVLAELAKEGRTKSTPGSRAGFGVGAGVNVLNTEAGQKLDQAKRNFINAVLRRESGAVIAESEFKNAEQQYFPQVGDEPGTIAQKAANRKTAIEGIRAEVPKEKRPVPAAAPTVAEIDAELRRRKVIP